MPTDSQQMPEALHLIYEECWGAWNEALQRVFQKPEFNTPYWLDNKVELTGAFKTSSYQAFVKLLDDLPSRFPTGLIGEVRENFQHLSLLDKEELSLGLLVDKFSDRLLSHCQTSLAILAIRLEALLAKELALEDIVLAPETLAQLVSDNIKALPLESEDKAMLLRHLLIELANCHRALVVEANNICIELRVLPDLNDADGLARVKRGLAKIAAQKKRKTLIASICKDVKLDDKGEPIIPKMEEVLAHLDVPIDELGFYQDSEDHSHELTGAALVDYLSQVLPDEMRNKDVNLRLSEYLSQQEVFSGCSLKDSDKNTIAMVSMLFDDLYQKRHFGKAALYIFEQLKLPVLKTALLDKHFFADSNNPAQALMDALAEQAASWNETLLLQDDALYQKVLMIVKDVNDHFDCHYAKFVRALHDLKAFLQQYQLKSVRVESRLVSMEKARARQKRAREQATIHVAERFAGLTLPEAMETFIEQTWQPLLFYIHNQFDSKENKPWHDAVACETLWLQLLLGKGTMTAEQVLDAIREQLLNVGKDERLVEQSLEDVAPAMQTLANQHIGENASEHLLADNSAGLVEIAPDALEIADNLQKKLTVGTWVLFNGEGEDLQKIKVAAFIKHTDTYFFVRRDGTKFASFDSSEVTAMLAQGKMELIESALQFDRSLESVITRLR